MRMLVLRTLDSLGAAVMRNGVFLLPETLANLQAVEHLVDYITKNGGTAQALRAAPLDLVQYKSLRKLFDRSSRYAALTKTVESLKVGFGVADPSAISRVLHKPQREFETITALDFFLRLRASRRRRRSPQRKSRSAICCFPPSPSRVQKPARNFSAVCGRRAGLCGPTGLPAPG